MLIDELLSVQMKERYKALIICGAGMTGKTKLVKNYAEKYNAKYIDVLEYVNLSASLSDKIETLKPVTILEWVKEYEAEDCVILDQLDFVFAIWSDTLKREFIRRLDMKSNGTCIVAVLHNYKLFEQDGLMKTNGKGQSRIINIVELI